MFPLARIPTVTGKWVHWLVDSKVRSKVSSAALGELPQHRRVRRKTVICPFHGSPGLWVSESHSPHHAQSLASRNALCQVLSSQDSEACRFSFLPLWLVGVAALCAGRAHSWFKTGQVNQPSRTFSQNWSLGFLLALVWLYSYGGSDPQTMLPRVNISIIQGLEGNLCNPFSP